MNKDTRRGKRILILVENAPVPRDKRVLYEARTLVEAGYSVSVICPTSPGEAPHEMVGEVSVHRYPAPPVGDGAWAYIKEYAYSLWKAFFLSLKVRRREGFDVIQACNPPDILFLIARFHKLFGGRKFVFDHHDVCPELVAIRYDPKKKSLLYKLTCWMERLTFKTADVVISTNESYKQVAVRRGGKDPEQVFVVRNGPDLDRLKIVPANPDLKRGRKHLVCYVGVMAYQDGVDNVVRAARHIVYERKRDDVGFALVGFGDYVDRLKELSKELEVDDVVEFTGRISDSDLCEYLSTADVCAAPDPMNDFNDKCTFIKIAEYMTMGKPIVCFNLTESRYTAQDAATYVEHNDPDEFGDRILELLDDPERRAKMGEFGKRRVHESLAWVHSKPNLLRAYDGLLGVEPERSQE